MGPIAATYLYGVWSCLDGSHETLSHDLLLLRVPHGSLASQEGVKTEEEGGISMLSSSASSSAQDGSGTGESDGGELVAFQHGPGPGKDSGPQLFPALARRQSSHISNEHASEVVASTSEGPVDFTELEDHYRNLSNELLAKVVWSIDGVGMVNPLHSVSQAAGVISEFYDFKLASHLERRIFLSLILGLDGTDVGSIQKQWQVNEAQGGSGA